MGASRSGSRLAAVGGRDGAGQDWAAERPSLFDIRRQYEQRRRQPA